MSNMSQQPATSAITTPPRLIVNKYAMAGWLANAKPNGLGQQILSGSVTANTLSTVLNLTGPGTLEHLHVFTNDATSRTIRMKLVLDGVAVFDFTSAAIASSNSGGCVVGVYENVGSYLVALQKVPFKNSCVFSIASSLTETNTLTIGAIYSLN